MIRILLVDDHAVVRRGVRDILTEALGKVAFGEASKPSEAMEKLQAEDWDVVVLDISLPGRGGLDALREIKRLRPSLPVLVLSMHAEDHYALRALRAGAAGYVNKESAAEDLSGAVRKVLAGGTHVSTRLAETLAKSLRVDTSRPAHDRLSDRELEVLRGSGRRQDGQADRRRAGAVGKDGQHLPHATSREDADAHQRRADPVRASRGPGRVDRDVVIGARAALAPRCLASL